MHSPSSLVPRRLGALAVHALGVGDEARAQELLGHVAPGGMVHGTAGSSALSAAASRLAQCSESGGGLNSLNSRP